MLATITIRDTMLALLLFTGACNAETINGTLYADQSGSGGGVVRIATSKCLFDLDYSKGYLKQFTAAACKDIGAKWDVDADITHPGSGLLRTAHCVGKVDESIHASWLVASQYLTYLAAQSYDAASKLTSKQPGAVFNSSGPRDLDVSSFTLVGGHGMCLSVSLKEDNDHVVLRAEETCGISKAGKPVYVLIHVEKEKGYWRVQGISAYY